MAELKPIQFDPASFLASTGLGRRIVQLKPKQTFFSQGNPADCIFYLQKGRAKLTVVSKNGKEATITLLGSGELCWRRVDRGNRWVANGNRHCHYRLYSAQDREAGDDARDARGAFL